MNTRSRHLVIAVAVVVSAGGIAQWPLAQAPALQAPGIESPTFEVASVKRNTSNEPFIRMGGGPGGNLTATNVPLRMLIRNAYQLQEFQIVGGPDWMTTDRFDITAKAGGDVQIGLFGPAVGAGTGPTPAQVMLRNLLADRFKLTVHNETRELPVYALVLARADGKPGPQLRPSAIDCAATFAGRGRGGRGGPGGPGPGGPGPGGPPPPPAPGQTAERPQCGMRIGPGNFAAGGITVAQFATSLSNFVQRVVLDRTGLTGNFDLDLTYTPDQMPQGLGPGGPPPGAPPLPPIDPNGPSIFTAVQEQLGLKLESQRGPVEVLVIDSVQPPTED